MFVWSCMHGVDRKFKGADNGIISLNIIVKTFEG